MQNTTHKIVIMLGNSKVGKTCLLTKLIRNKIETKYRETFGCDFFNYEITQLDQKVNLSIWDTYGDEDKISILPTKLYKQAKAFIIVCSFNDKESLNDVKKWTDHIRSYTGLKSNIPILLLVNQSDIQNKEFSIEDSIEISRINDLPNVHSSSIYGNVQIIFSKLCELLLGRSFPFRKSSVVSQTTRISLLKASTNHDTRRVTTVGEVEYNIDNVTVGSTYINSEKRKIEINKYNNSNYNKNTNINNIRDINNNDDKKNKNNVRTLSSNKDESNNDLQSIKIVKKSHCCF